MARLRREAGLSQTQLAGDDLSPSYISLLESGKRQPSSEVVARLAARLSCSPSVLLDGRASERERRIELELSYARLALTHGESLDARDRLEQLLTEGDLGTYQADEATLLFANALERLGDLQTSIEVLLPLFDRSCHHASHLPISTVGVALCGCYSDAGDFQRAVQIGQQALDAAVAQGLTGSEDYFRLAATLLWAYCETGDLVHGMSWANSLIAEAETHASSTGRAAIYWNAAIVAQGAGEINKAIHLSQRALASMSEGDSTRDLARLRIGLAHMLLGTDPPRTTEAWSALELAQEPLFDLGSQAERAHWERTAGLVRLCQGRLDEARQHIDLALRRPQDSGPEHNAESLTILGDICSGDGDEEAGRQYYRQAVELLRTAPAQRATARQWRDLAERLQEVDEALLALECYRNALDILRLTDTSKPMREAISRARAGELATPISRQRRVPGQ